MFVKDSLGAGAERAAAAGVAWLAEASAVDTDSLVTAVVRAQLRLAVFSCKAVLTEARVVDAATSPVAAVGAVLDGAVVASAADLALTLSGKALTEARAPVWARLGATALALPTLLTEASAVVTVSVA